MKIPRPDERAKFAGCKPNRPWIQSTVRELVLVTIRDGSSGGKKVAPSAAVRGGGRSALRGQGDIYGQRVT